MQTMSKKKAGQPMTYRRACEAWGCGDHQRGKLLFFAYAEWAAQNPNAARALHENAVQMGIISEPHKI